jgi:hypothetical protein
MKNTSTNPIRVLFIGNSFTARNGLPSLLTTMAAQAKPATVIKSQQVLANGASLRQHWNAGTATEKIRGHHWDYVVLQEQSTLPIKNAARFHENVRLFHAVIQECDAQTVLYLTWARQNCTANSDKPLDGDLQIAAELCGVVAPSLACRRRCNKICDYHSTTKMEVILAVGVLSRSVLVLCGFIEAKPMGLSVPDALNVSQMMRRLCNSAWQTGVFSDRCRLHRTTTSHRFESSMGDVYRL